MFPKIKVPQEWMVCKFIIETPIKMDDLGVPLFFGNTRIKIAFQANNFQRPVDSIEDVDV